MKGIISRLPGKLLAAVAAVTAVIGVTAAVSAWSPERPTYTVENPAPHVTFNSVTNNPNYGDERTFFDVKDAAITTEGGFVDRQNVQDGKELLLRVYVHNNAASSLNGQNFDGPGVARNTKVRIHLPTATAEALRANAYISADNATPKEVADTVDFMGTNVFGLEYVPGSARQYTNAVPAGMALSDSIVTTGAPIGHNQADGNVPGCFEYTSIVTIKVKVKMPSYSVQKSVRHEGQTSSDWKESITAEASKNVEWRIEFKNNGSAPLKQVKVVDELPAGLTVVPGSVKLYNGNYPNGFTYPDSAIQKNGRQVNVNIGDYNPGINAFVLFKTTTPAVKDLDCGVTKLPNVAYATPDGLGTVSDGAEVQVDSKKVCEQPKQPEYDCKAVTVKKVSGRKVSVEVNTLATNGATVKQYSYDFGDGKAALVTDKNKVEYTYDKDGKYVVRVKVSFTVNGQTKEVTNDACAKPVEFTTPGTPTVLPNTGVGDVLGIFAAVSVAGAIAHRILMARRFAA